MASDPVTAYRSWSGPARQLALAVEAAVTAAQAGDPAAFAEAITDLNRVDSEQLAVVLGAVMHDLIERGHPDGLDSDDVERLMQSCTRSSAAWYPGFDADCLVVALTDALGTNDPDDSPALGGALVVTHGLLLIADQLTTLRQGLAAVLDWALQELMRAQTIELP
jgi:hypothetical protein